MFRSDWSQFIPEIVAGLLLAAILWFISKFFPAVWIKIRNIAALIFGILPRVKKWILSKLPRKGTKSQHVPAFTPIALLPGIGNAYLRNLYINLPEGNDVKLDGVPFLISRNTLYFDTNEQLRYYLPLEDGGREVEMRLPKPVANVKKVHALINSGNSKNVYANQKIGEIRLLFSNIHPISTDLILGYNIREWAVGNQGDYIREPSVPTNRMAWQGMNKQGVNAVIDHLEIVVPDAIRNAILEKIVFVHRPTRHATDGLGVQYLVFAVTVEAWS
jgi:hypothetical protein